jgi:uncharacterized surface protein with fasciclin (FAS1) repeats
MANTGKRIDHGALLVKSMYSLMLCLALYILDYSLPTVVGLSTNNVALTNDGRLSTFKQLLDRAGISPTIGKTVIAPTKEAFVSFRLNDTARYDQWMNQPEFFLHFKDLMEWHMITENNYTYEEIFDDRRKQLENPQGFITVDQRFEMIDNVHSGDFVESDILTSDGVIHVVDKVMFPPFFGYDMITQLLNSRQDYFSFSTMANLALHAGLDDRINAVYEKGITFLVPPNRRFNRAEIDIPKMLKNDMFNYTRDFVLCHMIKDNWHVAQIFAINENTGVDQFLVKSELGTHMWITSTEEKVRFQSQELLLPDQPTPHGYVRVRSRVKVYRVMCIIIPLLMKQNGHSYMKAMITRREERLTFSFYLFCFIFIRLFSIILYYLQYFSWFGLPTFPSLHYGFRFFHTHIDRC